MTAAATRLMNEPARRADILALGAHSGESPRTSRCSLWVILACGFVQGAFVSECPRL